MHDIDDAYDLLHTLEDLPSERRWEMFSEENARLLASLSADLLDGENVAEVHDPLDFVSLFGLLEEREAFWSKKMGNAFLDARERKDKGDKEGAISVLNDFLATCTSNSFREVAEAQRDAYL